MRLTGRPPEASRRGARLAATAKASRSLRGSRARTPASSPASSSAVTSQTSSSARGSRATTRPTPSPRCTRPAVSPCSSSSSSVRPSPLKRANTPLSSGPSSSRDASPHPARPRPARNDQPRDLLGAGRAERRARGRDARGLEPAARVLARARLDVLALDPHRAPLAARRRSGTARDRRRRSPARAWPRSSRGGPTGCGRRARPATRRRPCRPPRRSRRRTSPPARRSLAGQAVDRLHEATAEASAHVELRAQHAHHGVTLVDLVEPDGAELAVPEVARDAQRRRAAGALGSLARSRTRPPRARGSRRAGLRRRRATRLTAPRPARANERTRPALRATTR